MATNRSRLHTEGLKDAEIDNDVRQGIFVLLLVVYEVLSLRIIALNLGKPRYPVIIGLLAAASC
ncbi:MAG: hypothetical protein ACOX2K_05165 [Bacillota bacterium]